MIQDLPGIELALESFVYLSLNTECQKNLARVELLSIICNKAEMLRDKLMKSEIEDFSQSLIFENFHSCLLHCVRFMSNICMTVNNDIIFNDTKYWNLFESLQNWRQCNNLDTQQMIREESKLTMFIYPNSEIEGDARKISFFLQKCLSSSNILIQYKALGAIAAIAKNSNHRQLFWDDSQLFKVIIFLIYFFMKA